MNCLMNIYSDEFEAFNEWLISSNTKKIQHALGLDPTLDISESGLPELPPEDTTPKGRGVSGFKMNYDYH